MSVTTNKPRTLLLPLSAQCIQKKNSKQSTDKGGADNFPPLQTSLCFRAHELTRVFADSVSVDIGNDSFYSSHSRTTRYARVTFL